MQESDFIGVPAGDHDHLGPTTGAEGAGKIVGVPKKPLCQVSEVAMVLFAERPEVPTIRFVCDVIIGPTRVAIE
jgi:hypothetical protein